MMLTAFAQRELVERARDAGAMAYLVKPFTQGDLVPAIELAVSRYAEIVTLEAEVADLGERFETRKRVERAKSLLQQAYKLSEADAFRWLQKSAMDRRLSMREVADVRGQYEKMRDEHGFRALDGVRIHADERQQRGNGALHPLA